MSDKYWDHVNGGECPFCGCPENDLQYDVVHYYTKDGELDKIHDVVDCPKCKRRLYEESD